MIALGVLTLVVAVAVAAFAGGGDDDSNADELDELREQVAELEAENEELRAAGTAAAEATEDTAAEATEDTAAEATEDTAAEEATTTEPATTTPPATAAPTGVPAAPDASPYAAAFGDIRVVSLPAGDPGVVAVLAATATLDDSRSLPVIVRNNTANTIGQIEVTGIARDAAGTLVGSGSSQGFEPVLVEPGEIAWGYVYFGDITGDGITFELSTNGNEPGYFMPVEITELNAIGDQIIGALTNNSDSEVSGPIGVGGVCFAADGTLAGTFSAYAEQDDLAPGGIGSFSTNLYGDPCPVGLAGASGYGDR